MADPLNLVGKTFAGYAVEKKIGAGGMGVVFRAFDDRLRRVVALKILPPALAREEETRLRFLREGRTAAKIDHGNAVRLLAAGEEGELAFLVMEFVDGGSLQQRIDRFKKLPAAEVIAVSRQVAAALGAGHRLGILHRDVKPANVLFTREGEAKLADYGLAKEEKGDQNLSMTGMVMGTPHYMAPEVCEGKKADARSDLYALGVMMYYMACGKYPFDSESVMQLLMAHVQEAPPPLAGVPAGLKAVIERLLSKDPGKRYANADKLIAALDAAAADPEAAPAPGAEAGARPPSGDGAAAAPGSSAGAVRPPSTSGAASPGTLPGLTAPMSLAAPLPVPQWHFLAYAVAGLAFVLSAILLAWVFLRNPGSGGSQGAGNGKKVEQNVDPGALARGELQRKWTAFQARARLSTADIPACLKEAEEYSAVDAAGVELLRLELLDRWKSALLERVRAKGDALAADAAKGSDLAVAQAAERETWPEVPFVRALAEAEDAVEVKVWAVYLDRVAQDVGGLVSKEEYRLAIDRWDAINPPKLVGRKRVESAQQEVMRKAKAAADQAIETARGPAGAKMLRELGKKMPRELKGALDLRATDLEKAEDSGDPMDQLAGMLAARDFAAVQRQLDVLEASGKFKDGPVLARCRRLAAAGRKTVERAMESWRAGMGRDASFERHDGTTLKGRIYEVSDEGDQLTVETGSVQVRLRLDDISPRTFAAAALGAAPPDEAIVDALDFALALKDRPAACGMLRRLMRRRVETEPWQRKAVSDLLPREMVAEAEGRLAALRTATPGLEAADQARAFLSRFGDWPMTLEDRAFAQRLLAGSGARWAPGDLGLVFSGDVEDLPDGTSRVTWTDDRLLEDALGVIGGVTVSGGDGLTLAATGDGALLGFPLVKWKDPRIRLEVRSTDKMFALLPAWRMWSEGVPSFLSLRDGLSPSAIVLPSGGSPTPVPTREDGWYVVEVSVTGAQYVLSVNGAPSKVTLLAPVEGAFAMLLSAPLVIRSLSVTGRPDWAGEDPEAAGRELSALIAENAETPVPAGQWNKPASRETAVSLRADAEEKFLKPPQWPHGADYIVRFTASVSGRGTTEKWPELVLDFRTGGKHARRFYLSGQSRVGIVTGDRWQSAGICREMAPLESHEVTLAVKGDAAMLVIDGQVAWMGHCGPASTGGPAIGVRNGTLEVSDLKVRARGK
ncbi:MAG: serine/threonine protein kinase [Planctomycetia bacterium]|nr:serine/threonine protein kinase [Planctomycetia bacterium]